MGVNHLWEILSSVSHSQSVSHLKGKTVAVDLSSWVYKSLNCRFIADFHSKKIMLRHIFFRIGCLLENDVHPILIIEGPAPTLKDSTLIKRRQNFYRTKNVEESTSFHSRDKFISLLQECQVIADILGVPCIQSEGEAEALCAALNMAKIVAGCITDDSDAFLYGADVVYRNFCIKESVLTCYRMTDIQEKLKLDREKLVALAILLGCDFNANGIPGVGKEKAMEWIYTNGKEKALQRFEDWKQQESIQNVISEENESQGISDTNSKTEANQVSKLESYIKQKFLSMKSSLFLEVIHEFLDNQPYQSNASFEVKEPNLEKILEVSTDKLGWSSEYSIKKIFPFVTHWNMKNKIKTGTSSIQLLRIIKPRTVKSVPCLEVQWHKPEIRELNELPNDLFITIEQKDLVSEAFPEEVKVFQNLKEGSSSDEEFQLPISRNSKRRSCHSVQSYKEDSDSSDNETPKQRRKKYNQQPAFTTIKKYHTALACNTNNTGSVTYLKMVLDAFQGDPTLQLSLQSIKKHISTRYLVSKNKLVFNKSVKKAISDALHTETLKKVSGKGIGGTYQLNINSQSFQPNKTAEES